MNNIHLITLFSRHYLFTELLSRYLPMRVIWHLLRFESEKPFPDISNHPWIIPMIIPDQYKINHMLPINNYFILNGNIVDDDYYIFSPDDDMYEPGVMRKIRGLQDPVVVISMKRGHHVPSGCVPHPTDTLIACPENMRIGRIGGEQIFVKGKVFKAHRFREDVYEADGYMALEYAANYPIRFEPDLYVLFNYYQEGRWDK